MDDRTGSCRLLDTRIDPSHRSSRLLCVAVYFKDVVGNCLNFNLGRMVDLQTMDGRSRDGHVLQGQKTVKEKLDVGQQKLKKVLSNSVVC